MSAYCFIVQLRVNAAIDDIVHTEWSIGRIAIENGFYDQSSFTRAFRLKTGLNPLMFRRVFRSLNPAMGLLIR